MDNFSIFDDSFQECLHHLELVLNCCHEKHLTLFWKKYHFMVQNNIVLKHVISKNDIEIDKTKVGLIINLPSLQLVKDIWCFLSHAKFFRRFIKNISKIIRRLIYLLAKNVLFNFILDYFRAFEQLKKALIPTPIIIAPN